MSSDVKMFSVDKYLMIPIILAAATALTASTANCENSTKAVNNYENGTKAEPKVTSGEVLGGDDLAMSNLSLYEVRFKEEVENRELCNLCLAAEDFVKLRDVIEDFYYLYFEFIIDDIPVLVPVGYLDEYGILPHMHDIFLFTHITFDIGYNGSQIMSVDKSRQQLPTNLNKAQPPLNVSVTYSVKWHPTKMKRADHTKLVQDNEVSRRWPATWLLIVAAAIIVVCIALYVAMLAGYVRNDLKQYNRQADEEAGKKDLLPWTVWKVIHGDIFSCPLPPSLFCAIIGAGTQFLVIVACLLIAVLLGLFRVHRHGVLDIIAILLYGLSSFVSGYFSVNLYRMMGGKHWLLTLNLTSALFSVPCLVLWALPNTVTLIIDLTQVVVYRTVALRLAFWTFVGYQLMAIGVLLGRMRSGKPFVASTSTKPMKREFSRCLTYSFLLLHCIYAGLVLGISCMIVELCDFPANIFGEDHVQLFGVLCVFCSFLPNSAAISVIVTYKLLSAKDHRWWWRSVIGAGLSGLGVLVYGLYYSFNNYNILQVGEFAKFIGNMFLLSYVFSMVFTAVSFFVSLWFILYVHDKVKIG